MASTPEYWQAAFSSVTGKWDTPKELVNDLATVFPWDIDVCSDKPNVCPNYYDERTNGLAQTWKGLSWMNPPYGKVIPQWIEKARRSPQATTICLIPARTDTTWLQNNAPDCDLITLIRGRLKFGSRVSWIARHQARILKKQTTPKQIAAIVSKIGGLLCCDAVLAKVAGLWPLLEFSYPFAQWEKSIHLRKDSAPFPSAFLVYGTLKETQKTKLASYGMTFTREGEKWAMTVNKNPKHF